MTPPAGPGTNTNKGHPGNAGRQRASPGCSAQSADGARGCAQRTRRAAARRPTFDPQRLRGPLAAGAAGAAARSAEPRIVGRPLLRAAGAGASGARQGRVCGGPGQCLGRLLGGRCRRGRLILLLLAAGLAAAAALRRGGLGGCSRCSGSGRLILLLLLARRPGLGGPAVGRRLLLFGHSRLLLGARLHPAGDGCDRRVRVIWDRAQCAN